MNKKKKNEWPVFISAIWNRFENAIKSPLFIFYFLLVVLGVSGAGIWLPPLTEYVNDEPNVSIFNAANFLTFCFALLGVMLVEVLMTSNKNKTLIIPGVLFGLLSMVFLLISFFSKQVRMSLSLYLH